MKESDEEVSIATSPMNAGLFLMGNGLSRLQTRFLGQPERVSRALEQGALTTPDCTVNFSGEPSILFCNSAAATMTGSLLDGQNWMSHSLRDYGQPTEVPQATRQERHAS